MSPRPTLSATLAATALFVTACGDGASIDDDAHGHGHHDHDNKAAGAHADHDDDHGHADHGHTDSAPSSAPKLFQVGSHHARLSPTADGIRLQLTAADGSKVAPSGDARVVLTGTGEEPQRIKLAPQADAWVGRARAQGAAGYVAVVSVELDGHTETGKVSWGKVPEAKAAPKSEPAHAGADDDAHGHGHGH